MSVSAAGRFITFEGGEGAGKSTQVRLLAGRLNARGIRTLTTREPGGSPRAEEIREVILSGHAARLGPLAEALLFASARADHLASTIRPALARGEWVICDRFADSTRAYQGVAGGLEEGVINALERLVVGPTRPDLTIVLDLPAEVGLRRANHRRGEAAVDRFESEPLAFHRALRDAFRAIAERDPGRCALVDASGTPEEVGQAVWACVWSRLIGDVEGRGHG